MVFLFVCDYWIRIKIILCVGSSGFPFVRQLEILGINSLKD